jgi:hypothetical protein
LLPNGLVLVVGGVGSDANGNLVTLASAELFDPRALQVVAVDTTGVLWHTFRRADGSWVPAFGNVNQQANNGGSLHFGDASGATERNGSLHVIAVGTDGVLWHTIRHPDGSWQAAFDNVNQQESNGASLQFRAVSCAIERNGTLQLVARDTTGVLWHTLRHPDGSWQAAFDNVNQQNGASLPFSAVSCAIESTGSLHVVATDMSGVLWHTLRHPDGSWVGAFDNVSQQNRAGLPFSKVYCALENTGSLQLVAADTTGVLWHTIRHADGSWVGAFGNVNQQESNGASLRFGAVSCATDTTGSLQLVARDTTGVLQHTIRRVNGSWVPAFGNVNQVESNGASLQFQTVSCA